MRMKKILLSIVFLLMACSNPYYKFYRGAQYERNSPPSCIYLGSVSSIDDIQDYLDKGYSIMGESGFSSTTYDYNVNQMINACDAVGGDAAVIIEPEYLGTENVMRTYYTYQPGQTYTVNSTTQESGDFSGEMYERNNRVGSYNGSYSGKKNTRTTIESQGHLDAHPYMSSTEKYAYRAVYLKKKFNEDKFLEEGSSDSQDICSGSFRESVWFDVYTNTWEPYSPDAPHVIKYCNERETAL